MDVFSATPFWRSEGGGNVIKIERYAFPNGWGAGVIARVADGLLAMYGDVSLTEPDALFPADNDERQRVSPERARKLIELPEKVDFDEAGFAEWRNLEELREFMSRVAKLPTHRLVST